MLDLSSEVHALGTIIGTAAECNKFFVERLQKFIELRDELANIENTDIELILRISVPTSLESSIVFERTDVTSARNSLKHIRPHVFGFCCARIRTRST